MKNTIKIILFLFCLNNYSQDINIATNEYQQSLLDKIDSIQNTKSLTDKKTQFEIGKLYFDLFNDEFNWAGNNKVKTKNWFDKSIAILEKSANQGYPEAYLLLGTIYENTSDNYNNINKAIYWYKKLLKQKTYKSPEFIMHKLGEIYYTGYGGNQELKDNKIAFQWFKKSAFKGYPEAMSTLADMYCNGIGVSKDCKKAFYWNNKCSERSRWCLPALAQMYYYGKGTNKNFKKAYELFKKSAGIDYKKEKKGFVNPFSCYYLGLMYYFGEYVKQDYDKAFWWIETSAMNGDIDARSLLGYMLYYGQGTLVDKKLAFKWLQYSDKNNDSSSQYLLGIMYYYGEATEIDYKKAAYFIKKSYENGNKDAKVFWDKNELWRYQ